MRVGRLGRAHAVVLLGTQHGADVLKGWFVEHQFGRPLADAQALGIARVDGQAVSIGALQAVHAPRVFGFGPVEEAHRGMTDAIQVGDLERVQVGVLGVGDLGLPAEWEVAHGDAVRAVGMRGDHKPAGIVNDAVGAQYIRCRTGFGAAFVQLGGRNLEVQEHVFEVSDRSIRRKNTQDMKAKGGCKLKSRQNDHLVAQRTPLVKTLLFLGAQSALLIQPGQPFQFPANGPDTGHRVMVRDGNDFDALLDHLAQPIQVSDMRLLVVPRRRRVDMQVNLIPPVSSAHRLLRR